jgi:hypothetical protein
MESADMTTPRAPRLAEDRDGQRKTIKAVLRRAGLRAYPEQVQPVWRLHGSYPCPRPVPVPDLPWRRRGAPRCPGRAGGRAQRRGVELQPFDIGQRAKDARQPAL